MDTMIIFILVYIIIFFITRELWCWYLKINSREKTLEEISKTLKEMNHKLEVAASGKPKPKAKPKGKKDDVIGAVVKEAKERTKFQCHSCDSALTTSAKMSGKCQKCDAELKGAQLEM